MRLFLPQTTLEAWVLEDKADFKDGRLTVAEGGASYPLTPAVHFARVVSGSDAQKLASRVKTQEQVERLGAEQLSDSVILGETAYDVVNGYVAEVTGAGAPPAGRRDPEEADLLAAFLLNKL